MKVKPGGFPAFLGAQSCAVPAERGERLTRHTELVVQLPHKRRLTARELRRTRDAPLDIAEPTF